MTERRFQPPYGFLALSPEQSQYKSSRAVVVPVPYDATTSARAGAREGPRAIIAASEDLEPYDLDLGYDTSGHGIHTLPDVAPHSGSPEAMADRIQSVAAELLDDGKFVLTLGGEHTVAVGAVRAHAKRFPGLSVLSIDAHADLRNEYLDSPYNHACVMRRIIDLCPVVQVGMRSVSIDQVTLIREQSLPFFTPQAYRALPDGPHHIARLLTPDVYISFDLDGLDPSEMAAVGTPEPGGLFWNEVTALLTVIAAEKRIVGCDVTELAPDLGPPACAHLAAKLAYRIMGLALGAPPA
jgi:agmatinase